MFIRLAVDSHLPARTDHGHTAIWERAVRPTSNINCPDTSTIRRANDVPRFPSHPDADDRRDTRLRGLCPLESVYYFQDLQPATVGIARYHLDLRNPILPLFQRACAFCNKDIQGKILSRLRLNKSIQGEILSRLRLSLSFDQEISLCLLAHPLQPLTDHEHWVFATLSLHN